MGKKLILSVVAFVCVVAAGVVLVRVWSGEEDGWICEKGTWVMHGKPRLPPPRTTCREVTETPQSSMTRVPAQDTAVLYYQPMQCRQTAWQQWLASSGAQIKKDATDLEVLMSYYQDQDIEVRNAKRIETGAIVCQACDICPTSFIYSMEVPESVVGRLTLLGWTYKSNVEQIILK